MHTLWIGAVPVAVESADRISQSYEQIGGRATLRTMRGGAIAQRTWARLKTTIAVPAGRLPPAVADLDLDVPHVIACLAPRSVSGTTRVVVLPAARRMDVTPWGVAVLPNGFSRRVEGVVNQHTLTLDAVPGALRYAAYYLPQITALITDVQEQFDVRGAAVGWQLTAEEV